MSLLINLPNCFLFFQFWIDVVQNLNVPLMLSLSSLCSLLLRRAQAVP